MDENGFPEEAAFNRAFAGTDGFPLTGAEFEKAIIAQDDDNDYQERGYVAGVLDKGGARFAFLGSYGHCSCYGTWADLCGGGISDYFEPNEVKLPKFTWVGSVAELVRMAVGELDPCLTGRKVAAEDSDADHLRAVYAGVREWAKKNGLLPVERAKT